MDCSVLIPVKACFRVADVSQRNLCQFLSEPDLIETADIPISRSNVYFAFLEIIYEVKETAALLLAKYKLATIRPLFILMPSGTKEVRK
jgi:hypothetical protein